MKKDIVERLREASGYALMDNARVTVLEAAEEIERLRSHPCPYVTGEVTRYCTLTAFTLTDAEREAMERVIATLDGWKLRPRDAGDAATMRGLLERLGGSNAV